MTFTPNSKRSKTYRGPDGLMCDQSEAVDAKGIVKSGYSVAVGVMAADSAAPGAIVVNDTPSKPTDAQAGYVNRMTKRKVAPTAADASLASAADGSATHSAYVARFNRTRKGA